MFFLCFFTLLPCCSPSLPCCSLFCYFRCCTLLHLLSALLLHFVVMPHCHVSRLIILVSCFVVFAFTPYYSCLALLLTLSCLRLAVYVALLLFLCCSLLTVLCCWLMGLVALPLLPCHCALLVDGFCCPAIAC